MKKSRKIFVVNLCTFVTKENLFHWKMYFQSSPISHIYKFPMKLNFLGTYISNTDLLAGICFGWENFGRHVAEAMGRHVAEAMGRQTDLVLDASLPKHNKFDLLKLGSLLLQNILILKMFEFSMSVLVYLNFRKRLFAG